MTYPLIVLPFAAIALVVVLLTLRRPYFGRRTAASGVAAAVLVVLTAIFDNLMIAAGLFTYPEEHLSGLRVGLAPVEDFSYAICAAFLVPARDAMAQHPLEGRPQQGRDEDGDHERDHQKLEQHDEPDEHADDGGDEQEPPRVGGRDAQSRRNGLVGLGRHGAVGGDRARAEQSMTNTGTLRSPLVQPTGSASGAGLRVARRRPPFHRSTGLPQETSAPERPVEGRLTC